MALVESRLTVGTLWGQYRVYYGLDGEESYQEAHQESRAERKREAVYTG
jgi:hypothetical protein